MSKTELNKLTVTTSKGIVVTADITEIIKDINNYKWKKDWYTAICAHDGDVVEEFSTSEEEFNEEKDSMIKFISELTEEKLLELAENKIVVTKKNVISKRGAFIAFETYIYSNYDNYYGSHNMTRTILEFCIDSDKEASIKLSSKREQYSF